MTPTNSRSSELEFVKLSITLTATDVDPNDGLVESQTYHHNSSQTNPRKHNSKENSRHCDDHIACHCSWCCIVANNTAQAKNRSCEILSADTAAQLSDECSPVRVAQQFRTSTLSPNCRHQSSLRHTIYSTCLYIILLSAVLLFEVNINKRVQADSTTSGSSAKRTERSISTSDTAKTYEFHNKSIEEVIETLTTSGLFNRLSNEATTTRLPDTHSTELRTDSVEQSISTVALIVGLSSNTEPILTALESSTTESSLHRHDADHPDTNHGASTQCGNDDAKNSEDLPDDCDSATNNYTGNEKLANLQSDIKDKMQDLTKDIMREWMEFGYTSTASSKCIATFSRLLSGMQDASSWAFKFIDSSAKLPNGLMSGALSDFGDYDQCLAIKTKEDLSKEEEEEYSGEFSGRYCLVEVNINIRVSLAPNETIPKGIDENGVLWDKFVRRYWTSKLNKGFMVGICVPSKCLNDDVTEILNYTFRDYDVNASLIDCQTWRDLTISQKPDFTQVVILSIFGVISMAAVLGTTLHSFHLSSNSDSVSGSIEYDKKCSHEAKFSRKVQWRMTDFLLCFSVIRSWSTFKRQYSSNKSQQTIAAANHDRIANTFDVKIHNTSPIEERNESISHLSGLKLLVICWIMMGHSFLYPSANNHQYYRAISSLTAVRESIWFATTNFTLGIDILLYIIGFLFVFKISLTNERSLSASNQSNKMEILRLIFHKILRFWPTYLSVIGLAIVIPLLGHGPLWPETVERRLGEACRTNWWANLLFVNNMQDESQICLPSSWFLSIVMQSFLVGAPVLWLAKKFSTKIAIMSLTLLITTSALITFIHAYVRHIDAPVIRLDESFVMNVNGQIFTLYTRLYNNLGPFLVGMMGGFLLVRQQQLQLLANRTSQIKSIHVNRNTNQMNRSVSNVLRGICFSNFVKRGVTLISFYMIGFLVLASVFPEHYTRFWAAVYWALHRIGWAMFTGYIIHQCATGRWTVLKKLLSLSTLIPLSRLIFIAYLVYPLFMHIHTGQVRDGLHINTYAMLNIYITRLVFTLGAALILHLFVELPLCSLEETLLNRWIQRLLEADKSPSKFHPLLIVAPIVSSLSPSAASPSVTSENQFSNVSSLQASSHNNESCQQSDSDQSSLEFTVLSSVGLNSCDKLNSDSSNSPDTVITAIEVTPNNQLSVETTLECETRKDE